MQKIAFKKLFIFLLAFLLFACSSNPNSTLNHSPNEIKKTKNSDEEINKLILAKDHGFGDKDIVIFSTNDALSAYNENLGYAGIKKFIDNFDREKNFVTLVDTGNFSAGSEIADNSKGKSSIEIMNKMGYDIIVPGTYDFNYGLDAFYENMDSLNAKVVCCNIYNMPNKELVFLPYVFHKYNGVNVAFVGVTSPDAIMLVSNRDKFFDKDGNQLLYFFEDEDGTALYNQVQAAVDSARNRGADKVILLAHLGMNGITEKWSTTKVIENTKNIDAVIDGHSMEIVESGLLVNKIGEFIPIVQAGSKLEYLGALNITKEGYVYPALISSISIKTRDEAFQKDVDYIINNYVN